MLTSRLAREATGTFKVSRLLGALAIFTIHNVACAELEPKCAENSPERHGDFGCSYIADQALPKLLPAAKDSMLVISAYVLPGQTSRVHHHSGVEAFYTVDGEQCLETPTGAHRIPKGSSLAVPAGVTMRLVATGAKPRRGFAIVIYDASQPPTTRTEELESQLVLCR